MDKTALWQQKASEWRQRALRSELSLRRCNDRLASKNVRKDVSSAISAARKTLAGLYERLDAKDALVDAIGQKLSAAEALRTTLQAGAFTKREQDRAHHDLVAYLHQLTVHRGRMTPGQAERLDSLAVYASGSQRSSFVSLTN